MASSSPSSIIVRDARSEDAFQVAELGFLVFSITFGHSVEPHQLRSYLEESYSMPATAADISDPSKAMIVATNGKNGAIIGFALLTRGTTEPCIEHLQNTVELQRIYIHPSFHGKGVGKLLANRLENMAREQGYKYMWLGVWEENHKAMKVYEKLGYKRVGDHEFTIGEIVQTDHIMVKEL
jgi:ribosomal protein S18 acetylase RimI-like enzyme